MNVKGMIVAELNRKRLALVTSLEGLDKLIAEFGAGNGKIKGKGKRHRRTKEEIAAGVPAKGGKRTLSPEHIAKMQAARKAKKEVKGQAPATEGANLAAAAGE
jgi:hypothetical protein